MVSMMRSKTWKNISEEKAESVKKFLLVNDGVEDKNLRVVKNGELGLKTRSLHITIMALYFVIGRELKR